MTNEELVPRLKRILQLYPDSPSLQQRGLKELVEELEMEDKWFVYIVKNKLCTDKYANHIDHQAVFIGTQIECTTFCGEHVLYNDHIVSKKFNDYLLRLKGGKIN